MEFFGVLYTILVILHFVGLASLLGGFLVQIKAIGRGEGKILPAMWHGALTQLVTGLALVGIAEGVFRSEEIDNAKIGLKLAVAVLITVLVFVYRKKELAPNWALWAIGGLTLANVVVAVAWQ